MTLKGNETVNIVDPIDAQENKTMAVMAYILFFVPLITGSHKKSPFVLYHTNQGTVLFIACLIWSFVTNILSRIINLIPLVGWIISMMLGFLNIVFLILVIIGIINVLNSQAKPLPLIGDFQVIK